MNRQIFGFVLIALAILGGILAFANAVYVPSYGLAANMKYARVLFTNLGTALAGCAAVALVGVGLLIFGRRNSA